MRKKFRWIYVFTNGYELYITDKRLRECFVSKHRSVFNAERFIQKNYPDDFVCYDKDIKDVCEWTEWMDKDTLDHYFFDLSDKMEVA